MIRLSIKGTKRAATKAAKRRGIPVKACSTNRKRDITFCDTPCNKYMAVAKWYGEPAGEPIPGRGFKAGTLVFFSPEEC
jgi:hypothetical protein